MNHFAPFLPSPDKISKFSRKTSNPPPITTTTTTNNQQRFKMPATSATMPAEEVKIQPWKKVFPQKESDKAIDAETDPQQIDLRRSYATHAPNSKGSLIEVKTESKHFCPHSASARLFWSPLTTCFFLSLSQVVGATPEICEIGGGRSRMALSHFAT